MMDFIYSIIEFIGSFIEGLWEILPNSPFLGFQNSMPSLIRDQLPFVNWFVPIGDMVAIFLGFVTFWLGTLVVQSVMRYLGVIR